MNKIRVQTNYTLFLGCQHKLRMLAKVSRSNKEVVTRHPSYCPKCRADWNNK